MGLITWIKDKYNNHKFQKATQVLSDGKIDQAVEIFKEILDSHPDAPFSLLSIYHSIILRGIEIVYQMLSLYTRITNSLKINALISQSNLKVPTKPIYT